VFDQLKIKQQTRCFANEIASKSAIITNELSRLKVVSFSQYEYIAIVEIAMKKQNYISKTIG
jgi:exonuclease SbcC